MEAGLTFQGGRETGEERWSVSKGTELVAKPRQNSPLRLSRPH